MSCLCTCPLYLPLSVVMYGTTAASPWTRNYLRDGCACCVAQRPKIARRPTFRHAPASDGSFGENTMTTLFAWMMLFALVTSPTALAQMTRDAAIAKSEGILDNLKAGNTSALVKEFDDKMAQALPESKLQGAWPSVIAQFG